MIDLSLELRDATSTDLLMLIFFFGYLVFSYHPVRFRYHPPGVYMQSMYRSFVTELDASWDRDSKYYRCSDMEKATIT
jgi:hypothetical protein